MSKLLLGTGDQKSRCLDLGREIIDLKQELSKKDTEAKALA